MLDDSEAQFVRGSKEYLVLFDGVKKREKALDVAHDVRQFEIDLYWKRAAYFWTIIAVAFAGYFTCQNAGNIFGTSVISHIGYILSLSWYLVNRGGAAWQHNWELHIDLLEDDVTGPLYKTLINRKKYRFFDLAGPYPFSPSRVNALVSIFVFLAWIVLILRADYALFVADQTNQFDAVAVATFFLLTLGMTVILLTSKGRRLAGQDQIEARTRSYKTE